MVRPHGKVKRRTWPIWVVKSLVRNRLCWGKLNFIRWHNLQLSLARKCQERHRLRGIYRGKPCLVLVVSDSISSVEQMAQCASRIKDHRRNISKMSMRQSLISKKRPSLPSLEACVDTPRVISAALDASYFNIHAIILHWILTKGILYSVLRGHQLNVLEYLILIHTLNRTFLTLREYQHICILSWTEICLTW